MQARQAGTYNNYGANLAVDGNSDQLFGSRSCASVDSFAADASVDDKGKPAWWSVDLATKDPSARFTITNLTVYFCDDCDRGMCCKIVV